MIAILPVLIVLSIGCDLPAQRQHANPWNGHTLDGKRRAVTWLISAAARFFVSNQTETERRQQQKSLYRATCSYPVSLGRGQLLHRRGNISAVT